MQTRVELLCQLAAKKETTTDEIRAFISAESIDINARHNEYQTTAVDFAAQTGSVENVRFFVEEMSADLTTRKHNLIQWSEDERSDPATRKYLSNLDNELWKRFNDGTNELHIHAYLGRIKDIEEILEKEPDRVCDLSNQYYSPLYYAIRAAVEPDFEQIQIQSLLRAKMHEYKLRNIASKIHLLQYHIAMLFADIELFETYHELYEFLQLCLQCIEAHPEIEKKLMKL